MKNIFLTFCMVGMAITASSQSVFIQKPDDENAEPLATSSDLNTASGESLVRLWEVTSAG